MKLMLKITLAVLTVCTSAFADDGSWSNSFSISGGSIYSEEDNQDISLEKELLVFNGSSTSASFLFHNSSDSEVMLTCGFPVVHRIQAYLCGEYLEISTGKYGGLEIPGITFFETIPHPELDDEDFFTYPEVIPMNDFNNGRQFIGAEVPEEAGILFRISQDGREVAVDEVLLERRTGKESADLTFHFKHRLEFAPKSTSIVTVSYSQDLLYGNDGGLMSDFYRWNYLIGTGGTWKGPIGEFFFIKPTVWKGELPGMTRISARLKDGVDIYYASGYEPDRHDEFSLAFQPVSMMEEYSFYSDFPNIKESWIGRNITFPFSKTPAQDLVVSVGASSSLPDNIDVYADHAVIASAEFGPLAAFDGFTETSWCENVEGTGEGEYLEVELAESSAGFVISNGFKRFSVRDWVFSSGTFENMVRDDKAGLIDYFKMNSRVRLFRLEDTDGGELAVIPLEDERDSQAFFGIYLEPGKYRFVIEETYPGTKWADTCLAEIVFIPADSGGLIKSLFTDSFYKQIMELWKF